MYNIYVYTLLHSICNILVEYVSIIISNHGIYIGLYLLKIYLKHIIGEKKTFLQRK